MASDSGAARTTPPAVWIAAAASLALGLLFIFVRAPHPWGWDGFDHYHELALHLAEGRPFPTLEVPWGYAYFLAAFYRLFGDRPWIPLIVQAVLNASMPFLVYALGREWFSDRIAKIAAALTGVLSFNTVYASTQSSDAVCTVLFMLMAAAFVRGRRTDRWWWFGVAGVLGGTAAQFRPNLILVPGLLAAYQVVSRHLERRRLAHALLLVTGATVVLVPWIVRNYQLTRALLPTSVHGGVQLWYGTLQVGPYLNSRAYNPRAVFEAPAFEYTSDLDVPLVVSTAVNPCPAGSPLATTLEYWTDRDATHRRIEGAATVETEIPPPRAPEVVYYFVTSVCPGGGTHLTPQFGGDAPFLFFVSADHLGDLDVHGQLLDVFDIVRMVRRQAWGEPLPYEERLSAAGVADLAAAVDALTVSPASVARPPNRVRVDAGPTSAVLVLGDGSRIAVPRDWSGRITDVTVEGGLALALMHMQASLDELRLWRASGSARRLEPRSERDDIAVNRVFYRREPQMMARYFALSADNIRRDPIGFAAASVYRAVRLFVVADSGDVHTTQQFDRSRPVYALAMIASAAYLLLLVAGVFIAVRQRDQVALPLLLILYVPATLAPVLTNMRYTVTVQPLVLMFVAVAVNAIRRGSPRTAGREEPAAAGTRTARRP
jgi:hypothetical protein